MPDYASLAEEFGGTVATPPAQRRVSAVDYGALAREMGGEPAPPMAPRGRGSDPSGPVEARPDFSIKATADPSALDAIEQESASQIGGPLSTVARGYVDLNVGAAKSLGQGVVDVARLAHKVPGVTRFTDWLYGQGQTGRAFEAADELLAPENTTQRVGKVGGQIAQTIVPGRAVSSLGLKLASAAPRGLGLLARAGTEAAGAGAIAAAQNTDPTLAAGIGGAIPFAGAALGATGRVLGGAAPQVKRAVDFATRRGIPVDAATATDSKLVRGAQWAADRTFGGAMVGESARNAQEEALARVGKELAVEAYPAAPVVPEQAGQGIRDAITGRVSRLHRKANQAYGQLRTIEEQHVRPVPAAPVPEGSGAAFAPKSSSDTDLFITVLEDAHKNGYDGTPAQLRELLRERVGHARGLVDEMTQGNWGRRILQFVSDHGGIGKSEAALQGEVDRLWEMSNAGRAMGQIVGKSGKVLAQQFNNTGSIGGVTGVVRRNGGLSADQMMERFRADPEFASAFADLPDTELFSIIEEATRVADKIKVTPMSALAQVGVRPGRAWWTEAAALAGDGSDGTAIEHLGRQIGGAAAAPAREMGLPVDLRKVKEALRPVAEQMERQLPITQQRGSPGLKAIRNILDGDDYAPASIVDRDLSAIKGIARGADLPEVRDLSQGLAAGAVRELETAVQQAVAQAGPEATALRNTGRAAIRAKHQTADLLRQIREEPVQAFNQATWRDDTGIKRLREIAQVAPKQMQQLGRAYLDDLMSQATQAGRFEGGAKLQSQWAALGPETKKLLYPDKQLRQDLDDFFVFARKSAENPNPSGSAFVGALSAQAAYIMSDPVSGVALQIPAWGLSKLLHSKKGVRLLTSGLRVKTSNEATAGALAAQLRSFATSAGVPVEKVEPGTQREPSPKRQERARTQPRDDGGRFDAAPGKASVQGLGLRLRAPAPRGLPPLRPGVPGGIRR